MNKKLIDDITQIFQSFTDTLLTYLPSLEREVNSLIEAESKDGRNIELYLDTLLSLTEMSIADDLFIKLLEYYKNIDEEGARFYWNEYETEK